MKSTTHNNMSALQTNTTTTTEISHRRHRANTSLISLCRTQCAARSRACACSLSTCTMYSLSSVRIPASIIAATTPPPKHPSHPLRATHICDMCERGYLYINCGRTPHIYPVFIFIPEDRRRGPAHLAYMVFKECLTRVHPGQRNAFLKRVNVDCNVDFCHFLVFF